MAKHRKKPPVKAGKAGPPPVCTGTGTIMADFMPISSGLPSVGLCGICRQRVPLMLDAQTIAPHGWRAPSPSTPAGETER